MNDDQAKTWEEIRIKAGTTAKDIVHHYIGALNPLATYGALTTERHCDREQDSLFVPFAVSCFGGGVDVRVSGEVTWVRDGLAGLTVKHILSIRVGDEKTGEPKLLEEPGWFSSDGEYTLDGNKLREEIRRIADAF